MYPIDCVTASGVHKTDVRTPVYIDFDSFSVLRNETGVAGTFTDDEIIGAVNQAFEQWNHSASGREFYYAGAKPMPLNSAGQEDVTSSEYCGIGLVVAKDENEGWRLF